jgi:hypothetical protein
MKDVAKADRLKPIAALAIALVAGMSLAIAQTASPRFLPVYGISSPLSSVALFSDPCCSAVPSGSPNVGIYGVPFLGVAQGGTGTQNPPANSLLIGRGPNSPIGAVTPSSPGQVLIDQGSGLDPQFRPISGAINIDHQGIASLTGQAWTAWTPTPLASSGSFSSASASGSYNVVGKSVTFIVSVTISSAGTASGAINLLLPTGTPKRTAMAVCEEWGNTGTTGVMRIGTSGMLITRYDAGSLIATNNVVTCTGVYEQS